MRRDRPVLGQANHHDRDRHMPIRANWSSIGECRIALRCFIRPELPHRLPSNRARSPDTSCSSLRLVAGDRGRFKPRSGRVCTSLATPVYKFTT
jgi:hypothetical protein